VVNQEMARRFWPGRDPIGERLWFNGFEPKEHWLTVIGITADMRNNGLTEPPREQAWVCYSQLQTPAYLVSGNIVLRTAGDPIALTDSVRSAIHAVNPAAAASFVLMDDLLTAATARHRFQLQVLAGFALLALFLAAMGIYGVLSYMVASNRAAIGIRMALGARPSDVVRLVAGRTLLLVALGASAGIAACLACAGILRKLDSGSHPTIPRSWQRRRWSCSSRRSRPARCRLDGRPGWIR
jgi:hypothetical protein